MLGYVRRKDLQKADTDISSLTAQVLTFLSPFARKHDVELSLASPTKSEHQMAVVDPGQIEQVLINIVTNAIQASPPGGSVVLAIDRQVTASPLGKPDSSAPHLCIEIRDEGTGISEADSKHIFTPFFTTKEINQGTGLGLSVVHGIVRDHRGWVAHECPDEGGTIFRVYIPVGNV